MKTLVLESEYKFAAPIFGAAYAAPNYTDLGLLSTVLSPTENSRIQGLFKASE